MCSQVRLSVLASTATLFGCPLHKFDVKSAFLQTGEAARDVYQILQHDSADLGKVLWIFLTVVYGLVNTNSKW